MRDRTVIKVERSRNIKESKRSVMTDRSNAALRGCIKTSKGPWVVRRTTRNGSTVTKYRYPSDRERLNNKQRERNRRAVAHNIFAGLRAHGNYQLPQNADTNDLLKALCEEAGWYVGEDGTVYGKTSTVKMPNLINLDSSPVGLPHQLKAQQGYCTCENTVDSSFVGDVHQKSLVSLDIQEHDSDLTLRLSPPHAHNHQSKDDGVKMEHRTLVYI